MLAANMRTVWNDATASSRFLSIFHLFHLETVLYIVGVFENRNKIMKNEFCC